MCEHEPGNGAQRHSPPRRRTLIKPASHGDGPPVDEALLLALVRRELPKDRAREVYRLIHTYREWYEAHTWLLVQEFRGKHH
jgi:hypothetical protein